MSTKCLIKECKRDCKTRGLCQACYVSASNLVKKETVSWEDLEKKGFCKRKENTSLFLKQYNS